MVLGLEFEERTSTYSSQEPIWLFSIYSPYFVEKERSSKEKEDKSEEGCLELLLDLAMEMRHDKTVFGS